MAKVQKSLRIDGADAERVRALKSDDESESAVYTKVIRAGLGALEGAQAETEAEPAGAAGTGAAERELVEILKAQVAEKDAQIARLQSAMDAQAAAIAAEAMVRARRSRGLVARVRALISGEAEGETNGRG